MKTITFKTYSKHHGDGEVIEVKAEKTDNLVSWLGSMGEPIKHSVFVRMAKFNKIQWEIIK